MPARTTPKSDVSSAPLYRDLYEFIDVMGIKHTRVCEAFNISRSYWFKLKKQHMNGLSLESMHRFAIYFNLPPEKVMALCYMTYVKGLAKDAASNQPSTESVPTAVDADIDADFPPIG